MSRQTQRHGVEAGQVCIYAFRIWMGGCGKEFYLFTAQEAANKKCNAAAA